MKKWYWRMDCSTTNKRDWWAYGLGGEKVPWPDGPSDEWLMKFGFKTRAAAVRAAGGRDLLRKREWRTRILIDGRELPDPELHYEITRCYEIVIKDKDGNPVRYEYSYGDKAEAEEDAKWFLKLEKKDLEGYGEEAWKEGR